MSGSIALLVIDVQCALCDGAYRIGEVCTNIHALAERARSAGSPVVYLQHVHGSWKPMMKGEPGWAIHPDVAPLPGDVVLEKSASDAFYNTALRETLQRLGVSKLVITGMQTEYCVDATARSALSHGFDVVLASDAHTTGDSVMPAAQIVDYHNYVLPRIAHPMHTVRCIPTAGIRFDPAE